MASGDSVRSDHHQRKLVQKPVLFTGEVLIFTVTEKDQQKTIEECHVRVQGLENENYEMVISNHEVF